MESSRPSSLVAVGRLGLLAAGAGLLAASAGIHLDLYLTGYSSIPTIGWLFLLQVVTGFALAAAVVVTRAPLAAAAGAGFALCTLGGYLLSMWVGLFGFKEVTTTAGIAAGVIEVAAFAALSLAAVLRGAGLRAPRPRARAGALARVRAPAREAVLGVAAVTVLASALLGAAAATEGGPPPAAASAPAVTLRTANVGGVTVLTNSRGFTLYWFAVDTPAASRCTGSCAVYWPPVVGVPKAGPGVTGKLGTITRPGGSTQATYNGHPLYTYAGDTGPGQAHGNNLNLNGGLWHEARLAG